MNCFVFDHFNTQFYQIMPQMIESAMNPNKNKEIIQEKSQIVEMKNTSKDHALIEVNNTGEINLFRPICYELMIFNQIAYDSEKNAKTNWVYVQLETGYDDLLREESIKKIMKSIGIYSLKNIQIFQKESFIQKNDETQIEDIKNKIKERKNTKNKSIVFGENKISKVNKKKAVNDDSNDLPHSMDPKLKPKNKIFKLNESYGFIEFLTKEDKEIALDPNYHIFGIDLFGATMITDDADVKKVIKISNIGQKFDANKFQKWINDFLASKKCGHIKFTIKLENIHSINHTSFIYLKLQTFKDALTIKNLMDKAEFDSLKLNVSFKRGTGTWINGIYEEQIFESVVTDNLENGVWRKPKENLKIFKTK